MQIMLLYVYNVPIKVVWLDLYMQETLACHIFAGIIWRKFIEQNNWGYLKSF